MKTELLNPDAKYFRAKAPFDIPADSWFIVDLKSADVLLEDNGIIKKPVLGRRPFLDDGKDLVNHPAHYNTGRIEVIEFIEDQKLSYHLGNTIKYIARAGKKDPSKEIEDLEKAAWYLKRRIETLKAEREGRAALRPNDMVK